MPFVVLLYFLLLLTAVTGWVLNIIDIVNSLSGPVTAMFIARLVGIFCLPLGAVLGFL